MVCTVARVLLGLVLGVAGLGHFVDTESFLAQVPPWLPAPEWIVWISGVVELILAAALLFAPAGRRALVGWVVAAFFVAVFPGNVSQFVTDGSAFGLDSDADRAIRLLFQPVLVVWALWSTGAWREWRERTARSSTSVTRRR
ncbi:MAG: DoxX family protein [Dermatophilaceae bacterium]